MDHRELIIESKKHGRFIVLIDNDDWDRVSKYKWSMEHKSTDRHYATNSQIGPMHRYIINTPKGMCTDHINRNTLDNRKHNLRICTHAENGRNRPAPKSNTSGYKGVYLDKCREYHERSPWRARIQHNKKLICIGCYDTPEAAAMAYDKKALELFGEYAYFNFPREDHQ